MIEDLIKVNASTSAGSPEEEANYNYLVGAYSRIACMLHNIIKAYNHHRPLK